MAFDKNAPASSTSLRASNPQILANWDALETAIGQNHDFATGSTQSGKHGLIEFLAPISTPANSADEGYLYIKDVSSKAELHFENEDGDEIQLTGIQNTIGQHVNFVDIDGTPTAVYTKYLTGNLTAGATGTIAHGVAGNDKILSASVAIESSGTGNLYRVYDNRAAVSTSSNFVLAFDSTNVYISSRGTDVDSTNRYVIKLDYIL